MLERVVLLSAGSEAPAQGRAACLRDYDPFSILLRQSARQQLSDQPRVDRCAARRTGARKQAEASFSTSDCGAAQRQAAQEGEQFSLLKGHSQVLLGR
jgi:hypothetical protein